MPIPFMAFTPPSSKQECAGHGRDCLAAPQGAAVSAKRLWHELRGRGGQIVVTAVLGILSTVAALFSPYLIGQAIDCLTGPGRVDWPKLQNLILLTALSFLINLFFQWLMQLISIKLTGELTGGLREQGFAKVTRLPLSILDSQPHGDLLSRLSADLEAVAEGISQLLIQLFTGLPLLLGSLYFLVRINWKVSLIVFAITPLCYLVSSFIAKRSFVFFSNQARDLGRVNASLEENISNQALIQAYNAGEEQERVFDALNMQLYDSGYKAQLYSALTNPTTRFLNNVAYVLIAALAAIFSIGGALSVGAITAMLNYWLQFSKPINEISVIFTQLQNALAGASRVFALLDAPEEEDIPAAPALDLQEGKINFRDVSFSYSPERPLIQNLNLDVPSHALVAIVGPTGGGKTTLVNLLMRFYDLDGGSIVLDKQDISAVQRQSLRRNFGMVLQDTWIFSGTVHQNIAYGKPDATREEVEAAARKARAHGFIRRLPQGYDTTLNESGGELSAGQRQLLTIARVFLTGPELLILDEATSAIDTRTELLVQKAFLELMQGRTAFIIAHRLSTIREATHILVLRDGAIVEQGSHDELMERQGFYAELYESQYQMVAMESGT